MSVESPPSAVSPDGQPSRPRRAWLRREADREPARGPLTALEAAQLRLRTLIVLRWLAVIGQAFAVLFVFYGLGFDLPIGGCAIAIAAAAWLNIILSARYPSAKRLSTREAIIYLCFDVVQLSALLFLTGGLENPFVMLLLAPVTVSALTLAPHATVAVASLAMASATMLGFTSAPLPWPDGQPVDLPLLYVAGVWSALLLGVVFIAVYAGRIATETGRMTEALAATQLALSREQQLAALGGLAAAAAHELGTPLATIAVAAKEMERELNDPEDPLSEDITLIRTQAERCRAILTRIARAPSSDDEGVARAPVTAILEEASAPYLDRAHIVIEAQDGAQPELWRSPELLHGLGNIVENATDFAESEVRIAVGWTDGRVRLTVRDDGPGFRQEILTRIGEPYVTSRPRGAGGGRHGGMGLGVFIAKTLLERTGAEVVFANASPRGRDGLNGAIVTVTWPKSAIVG